MEKNLGKWPDDEKANELLTRLIFNQAKENNRDAFLNGANLRYTSRRATAKFLSHYEIYKIIADLPGHIVELGVFKGESLLRFAQFSEIFNCYDRSFEIIGFDNFAGFTQILPQDGTEDIEGDKVVGGWSPREYKSELNDLIEYFDMTRLAPQKQRVRLIDGNIENTVPHFKKQNPNMRIKLLHLDADLYEPTKIGLENFWDNIVIGGCLLLDEYGFDLFGGEAAAVDEFFKTRGINARVKKFNFSDNPGGYVIKEER